jgi:hypothetical protein
MTDFTLETLHTPAPGSSRDMVAQQSAQAEVTYIPADNPPVDTIIPVRPDVAEECIPRTLQLSVTNPVLQILPRDMRRTRAIVIPTANPVYLTESVDLAQQIATTVIAGTTTTQSQGGYIPVNVGVPLDHRDAMYAAISATATTSPVTVIVQRYAE